MRTPSNWSSDEFGLILVISYLRVIFNYPSCDATFIFNLRLDWTFGSSNIDKLSHHLLRILFEWMWMSVPSLTHTHVHHYCFTCRPNPDQSSCPLNVFRRQLRFQILMCFERNLTFRYSMRIINKLITLIFCRLVSNVYMINGFD